MSISYACFSKFSTSLILFRIIFTFQSSVVNFCHLTTRDSERLLYFLTEYIGVSQLPIQIITI